MKTIIAVSGYFEYCHKGHLEYLKFAKNYADNVHLIVILNNDKQSLLKKGFIFAPEDDRKSLLESIKYVDEVFLSIDEDETVCRSLEHIKPHIFAKGGDRYVQEIPEKRICD